jgi:hypothetical protein
LIPHAASFYQAGRTVVLTHAFFKQGTKEQMDELRYAGNLRDQVERGNAGL